ncbi:hypothetical protein AM587_10003735 [Phytophthora nicotianae]|uniref:Uncharacterized protein n=1 Tax=Phytophthora nicotianae TaxID=4792 RepID=A0A0W8CR94_PHYNI|nr:hypothetical protein AM587_10003735 [Phytophthora nicotianae]
MEYASASRCTLFHAGATFKKSDLGYPVITCGISDASRCCQLAAIFIVSRRTAKEYAMCLEAFIRLVKHMQPTNAINAARKMALHPKKCLTTMSYKMSCNL